MARIKDGKDYIRGGLVDRGAATIIELLRARGHRDEFGRPVPDPAPGALTGPAVAARLNHGRWIGDCNLPDSTRGRTCLNAQFVDDADQRFFCIECFNQDNAGRWRPVTWPADRAAVEAAVADLPTPEQNWTP